MSKSKPTKLVEVLRYRYGVDEITAPPYCLEWATTALAAQVGYPVAARQLRRVNAKRERVGRIPYYPQWGGPLFDAYFAKSEAS